MSSPVAARPSRSKRSAGTRLTLLSLAVGAFGIGTGEFVMLGLLPNVAAGLHASIPQSGYLISVYALGVVVGAPTVTMLTAHLPRKGLLLVLAALLALGNVGGALAPNFDSELVLRFVAGLPHGAYFGLASVSASTLVGPARRSQAMAVVFTGLTVANVVGVPLTTFVGQDTSWRVVYLGVAAVELVAVALIALTLPRTPPSPAGRSAVRGELAAFRSRAVWLILATATIGGGALFSIFSYIAPMVEHDAGYAPSSVTWLLVLFGLGMTAGNLVGARLADLGLMRTVIGALVLEVVVSLAFLVSSHNRIAVAVTIFLFPLVAMPVVPAVQAKLVALGGGAPNLAAASMHSAFNVANSIGAWVGGLALTLGFGYAGPEVAAALLALLGLGIALLTARHDRVSGVAATPKVGVEPAAA